MGLCECLLETLIDDLSGKAHTHFESKFIQNKGLWPIYNNNNWYLLSACKAVSEDIKNHISWDSNTSIITNLVPPCPKRLPLTYIWYNRSAYWNTFRIVYKSFVQKI